MSQSPYINSLQWGEMDVEGVGPGKDFIVYPGGAEPWDWNRSGTSHEAGIQPADVQTLLDHGATHVVLSTGQNERLSVSIGAREALDAAGVWYEVLPTPKGVETYNALADSEAVGGLFHSTC
ncbi:MAG: hypothetical protein GVY16_09680 [Planctomycetes bacterium]|jgi:hypothetical protein|nr:hypothetical protein [Planctomycetota bacterium]